MELRAIYDVEACCFDTQSPYVRKILDILGDLEPLDESNLIQFEVINDEELKALIPMTFITTNSEVSSFFYHDLHYDNLIRCFFQVDKNNEGLIFIDIIEDDGASPYSYRNAFKEPTKEALFKCISEFLENIAKKEQETVNAFLQVANEISS